MVIKIPKLGILNVGNLSFRVNSGLYYGVFGKNDLAEQNLRNNWFYGKTKSWNGISIKTTLGRKSTISSLVHLRETEKIGVVKVSHVIPKKISGYYGVSGSMIANNECADDTLVVFL